MGLGGQPNAIPLHLTGREIAKLDTTTLSLPLIQLPYGIVMLPYVTTLKATPNHPLLFYIYVLLHHSDMQIYMYCEYWYLLLLHPQLKEYLCVYKKWWNQITIANRHGEKIKKILLRVEWIPMGLSNIISSRCKYNFFIFFYLLNDQLNGKRRGDDKWFYLIKL